MPFIPAKGRDPSKPGVVGVSRNHAVFNNSTSSSLPNFVCPSRYSSQRVEGGFLLLHQCPDPNGIWCYALQSKSHRTLKVSSEYGYHPTSSQMDPVKAGRPEYTLNNAAQKQFTITFLSRARHGLWSGGSGSPGRRPSNAQRCPGKSWGCRRTSTNRRLPSPWVRAVELAARTKATPNAVAARGRKFTGRVASRPSATTADARAPGWWQRARGSSSALIRSRTPVHADGGGRCNCRRPHAWYPTTCTNNEQTGVQPIESDDER